eukprot:NODE_2288_length_805_cov_246.682540_g1486_i2.p1 GENE.NODE_2288_length_805_cov_246.682540_g1486_i2~~NODE_2288_length_805_cov_246.682540_g1486_i2.p1  ORF type:complete len:88 (+),score=12.07 NODE_2288_length_805_cov_246.682540_g1486_i2:28-291(+)
MGKYVADDGVVSAYGGPEMTVGLQEEALSMREAPKAKEPAQTYDPQPAHGLPFWTMIGCVTIGITASMVLYVVFRPTRVETDEPLIL